MMEEALKSSRVLFHLILASCAAITVLALSPDRVAPYDALLGRIDAIADALRPADIASTVDAYHDELIERHTRFSTGVTESLVPLGIAVSDSVSGVNLIPVDDPTEKYLRGHAEPTLKDIRTAVESPGQVRIFKLDDLRGEVTAWMTPFRGVRAKLESVRLGGIQGAGRPNLECYFELTIPTVEFSKAEQRIRTEMKALTFEPRIITNVSPVRVTVDVRLHGEYVPIPEMPVLSFLARKATPAIVSNAGQGRLLLETRQFDGMTLEAARVEVLKKRDDEAARDKLTLLGMEVDPERTAIAAPLVLLALFLYLVVEIQHLLRLKDKFGTELHTFPWVLLFPDWLSLAIARVTMVLWPAVAIGLLAFRSGRGHWIASMIACGLAIPILGLGLLVMRSASRLMSAK